MDLVEKTVRNTDGNIGIVRSLSIEDDRIEVYFEAYSGSRTYKFSLALGHSLAFAEREDQTSAEQLAVLARGLSEKKKLSDNITKKKKDKNPDNIYHRSERVDRESYRDNYYYGCSKSTKPENNSNNLSKSFGALKRTIKNASYDLKQPELKSIAPANKEDYYPDNYDERWDQACYVLRYSYAYAFEYYQLYTKILRECCKPGCIKVLSLGCGAMTDAWSLEVANTLRKGSHSIEYTGVDKARSWEDDYQPATTIITRNRPFFDTCAGSFLMSCSKIDYDIIIFPKSLRDIYCNDYNDYLRIKRAFETKHIVNRQICIAFSLINNPDSYDNDKFLQRDQEMINELIYGLKKQGFILRTNPLENVKSEDAVYYNSGYPEMDEYLRADSDSLTGKRMMTKRRYQKHIAYILEKER